MEKLWMSVVGGGEVEEDEWEYARFDQEADEDGSQACNDHGSQEDDEGGDDSFLSIAEELLDRTVAKR